MTREVSTNGRKKVSTLMKEFNANYPYLILILGTKDSKGTFYQCDINKTLSQVRTKKGSGKISFTGSKNVGTIERDFLKIFGLTVQIGYISSEGKNFYSTGTMDKQSLTKYNNSRAAKKAKKGVWKWS
jgi:hypothetical protein